MKLREKKVNVFGKSVPVIAVIAMVLLAGIAGAALVNYLSNTITAEATVSSPIELKGGLLYWPAGSGFLENSTDAIATWTNDEANSDNFSVHVKTTGTAKSGDEARIVIQMPDGFTLGQLETLSWWTKTEFGYPPHVDIILVDDIDGNKTNIDSITAEMSVDREKGGEEFFEILYIADNLPSDWVETFELERGDGHKVISDSTTFWVTRHGAGTDDAPYGTLGELKAGTPLTSPDEEDPEITIGSETRILRMEFEVDNWVVNTDTYIDDITINGDIYNLEPSTIEFVEDSDSIIVPLVPLRGGDEFYMGVEATNLANRPIDAASSCNVSAVDPTPDIEATNEFTFVGRKDWISNLDETTGILTITESEPVTINPMGTYAVHFKVTANPALNPGNYTFEVKAVLPPPAPE